MTPTNIAQEREHFFASETYEPQLSYEWDAATIATIKKNEPAIAALADALVAQDKQRIENEAKQYFQIEFTTEDIALAKKNINNQPGSNERNEDDAEALATILRHYLQQLHIPYTVEIVDEHGFQCRPQHKQKNLKISKYISLQFLSAEGVTLHELMHIIRAVNGEHNGITPQQGYLATEEGLACFVQDAAANDTSGSVFQHALEYLGAYMSINHGFRDIYHFFREHGMDADVAWQRAIRQKYGIIDTSQPGGLMKSGMYFFHAQKMRKLSQDELLRLFVGKIRLDQLAEHKKYIGAIPENDLKNILYSSSLPSS